MKCLDCNSDLKLMYGAGANYLRCLKCKKTYNKDFLIGVKNEFVFNDYEIATYMIEGVDNFVLVI